MYIYKVLLVSLFLVCSPHKGECTSSSSSSSSDSSDSNGSSQLTPPPPAPQYTKVCYSQFSESGGASCPVFDYEIGSLISATNDTFETVCQAACDNLSECISFHYINGGGGCILSKKTVEQINAIDDMAEGRGCFDSTEVDCSAPGFITAYVFIK